MFVCLNYCQTIAVCHGVWVIISFLFILCLNDICNVSKLMIAFFADYENTDFFLSWYSFFMKKNLKNLVNYSTCFLLANYRLIFNNSQYVRN